jgi:hypothetical protein
VTQEIREKIIKRFMKNVYGKTPETSRANQRHDGKEGHWLEKQMDVKPNASNTPDLWGYEMKNDTTSKTTFGDWSPNYWIFRDKEYGMTRDNFFEIFGKPNPKKNNRLSWSGTPLPKIHGVNSFGVKIVIDVENNISFVYSYFKDSRKNKSKLVPEKLKKGEHIIARWNAKGKKSISEKLERKFNQSGWFKCLLDKDGTYDRIIFGGPMNFDAFMKFFKKGKIIYDGGMYQGNNRPYSQWRSPNAFWDSLVISRHPPSV